MDRLLNFSASGGMLARLRDLRRDESGGIIIFSLFIFVVMLMAGGLAVDFMRTETARVKLQTTLDRAVLAAGDMDQELDPEAVVRDYVAKAGLDQFMVDVTVTDGALNRSVRATANANVRTFFAKMIGIEYVPAPASSGAAEASSSVEIALVLDISGSMSGTKLTELQEAAKNFVRTMETNLGTDGININIVPYSTQVAAPRGLMDLLASFNREHDFSNCISFDDPDYQTTQLFSLGNLDQAQHFDPFYNWGPAVGTSAVPVFVCNPNDYAEVMVMENDVNAMEDYIDALVAGGNTSIEIGMKWAAATLDPASGTFLSIFSNGLLGALTNPVAAFSDPDVRKIVVLMTDGANTTEWQLADINMNQMSDVYYDDARNEFWVKGEDTFDNDGDGQTGNDQWFSPRLKLARDNPGVYIAGENNYWRTNNEWPYPCSSNCTMAGQLRRLKNAELFERVSLYYNAYYHHYIQRYNIGDYNAWYWDQLTGPDAPIKNARLHEICDVAKDRGIEVYTVGFEVTDPAALVMEDCASSTSHFFRTASGELDEAFGSIARQTTALGLTQ